MVIYSCLDEIVKLDSSVLTIGSFDGLHLGHKKLLEETIRIANINNSKSVVITFNPHPKLVLNSELAETKFLLVDENKKNQLFEDNKIDILVILPFDNQLSNISAECFLENIIIEYFSPSDIVVGYDHHFGKNGMGNEELLLQKENVYDYKLHVIDEYCVDNHTISSTEIRNCIHNGDMEVANSYLGWHYELSGTVVSGNNRGTEIGFPTANIQPSSPNLIIPSNGAYLVNAKVCSNEMIGMCNIGTRPTFSKRDDVVIEVHLLDEDDFDIYGEIITVSFIKQLRKEIKFKNIESLKNQLEKDKVNCLKYRY